MKKEDIKKSNYELLIKKEKIRIYILRLLLTATFICLLCYLLLNGTPYLESNFPYLVISNIFLVLIIFNAKKLKSIQELLGINCSVNKVDYIPGTIISSGIKSYIPKMIGLLILFYIFFYNDVMYGRLMNLKRETFGLEPMRTDFKYERADSGGDYWYNLNEKKQGLYQSHKQQYRRLNTLMSESDVFIYTEHLESDTITLRLSHWYFPSENRHEFLIASSINLSSKNIVKQQHLSDNGLDSFKLALQYLKHREDSLQLN